MSQDNAIGNAAPSLAKLGPRIDSLDLLRGIAILGIFLMNTQSMLLPAESYWNPDLHMFNRQVDTPGDFHGWNAVAYIFTHLFADTKFITMFSFMFGAGIMLQGERVASRGMSPAAIHYTRMGVLLIIALIHAYLIWYGDILTEYALCGIFLFPLRRLYPGLLMAIGITFVAIGLLYVVAKYSYTTFKEFQNDSVVTAPYGKDFEQPAKEGDYSRVFPLNLIGRLSAKIDKGFDVQDGDGNPIRLTEPDAFTGDRVRWSTDAAENPVQVHDVVYWKDEIRYRTLCSLFSQTDEFPKWSFWRCGGSMLVGMALLRWRFFQGSWGKPAYWTIALFTIPCGMTMTALGIVFNNYLGHWDGPMLHKYGQLFNYVGSFIQALGYLCIGVLVAMRVAHVPEGLGKYAVMALKYAMVPIRSVGKMALSNYLFQSVVGTTLAYGHRISPNIKFGFGLYGSFERWQLLLIVPCVWATQMVLSTIWLMYFKQGPVEALWHKLVYLGRTFPLRPAEDVASVLPVIPSAE